MSRISQSALGRHLGVTQQAISKAVKAGRITTGADGKLDLDEALAQWAGELRAPRDGPGDGTTLQAAHLRKETALAELAELKAQVMRGDLLDRLEIESLWFALVRTLRDRMLGIPDRLAVLLAAETDEHTVRVMLDAEIRESLTVVADSMTEEGEG